VATVYAEGYSVYRNAAIVIVILLGLVAVMGAAWAPWGMRQTRWRSEGATRNNAKIVSREKSRLRIIIVVHCLG